MNCTRKSFYTKNFLLRTTLLSSLVLSYYFLYLSDIIEDVSKERSMTGTQSIKEDSFEPPAIIICTRMGFKPSFKRELGITDLSTKGLFNWPNSLKLYPHLRDENPWKLFKKATYQLDTEWNVTPSSKDVKLKSITTRVKGSCLLALPTKKVAFGKSIFLDIKVNKSVAFEDVPYKIQIIIASKNTWQRVINDNWGEYQPMMITTELSDTPLILETDLRLDEYHYLKGNEECGYDCAFKDCFHIKDILNQRGNCSQCIPFQLSHYFPDQKVSICDNYEDHFCNWQKPEEQIDQWSRCLKSKSSLRYSGYSYTTEGFKEFLNVTGIRLSFTFGAHHKTVTKEVLIYDFKSLLGNVGGALGLFIGFSFYDIFMRICTKLCSNINE